MATDSVPAKEKTAELIAAQYPRNFPKAPKEQKLKVSDALHSFVGWPPAVLVLTGSNELNKWSWRFPVMESQTFYPWNASKIDHKS